MIKTTQKAGLKVKLGSREVMYSYWWRTQVIICYKCGNWNNPLRTSRVLCHHMT